MRQYLCNRCVVWGGWLVAGWEGTLSPEIVRSGVGGGGHCPKQGWEERAEDLEVISFVIY